VDALAAPPPTPPETVPGDLLRRRPDVREAEARVATALSQYRVDQLALFPTFTLKPGVGLQRTDQPSFTSTTENWSIGLNASVPVLNRGRLKQLAKVSGARAEEAVIAYEKAVQTAYGEAESDLVQLAADRNRAVILSAGEVQARAAFEAARKGYVAGLTDLSTLLQVEQSWRAARTALTAAQVQALRRSVQTFKALGGGWTPPQGGAA
jgi:outer membrane protein TolC